MSKLYDTSIAIGYEQGDFETLPELIEDIGNEVKSRLLEEVRVKPLKCNIFIIYHSIVEGNNDLTKCKGLGLQRKQGRDNGKHNKKRLAKSNSRVNSTGR